MQDIVHGFTPWNPSIPTAAMIGRPPIPVNGSTLEGRVQNSGGPAGAIHYSAAAPSLCPTQRFPRPALVGRTAGTTPERARRAFEPSTLGLPAAGLGRGSRPIRPPSRR